MWLQVQFSGNEYRSAINGSQYSSSEVPVIVMERMYPMIKFYKRMVIWHALSMPIASLMSRNSVPKL